MRKTTGYFFVASKPGGFRIQVLHRRSARAVDGDAFGLLELHVFQPALVVAGERLGGAAAQRRSEDLGRRGQARLREDRKRIAEAHRGDRSASGHELRIPAGDRNLIEIVAPVAGRGEDERLAVFTQAEFADRQIRVLEQRAPLSVGPIVDIEIPAIGFESRTSLRPDDHELAVSREHRLRIAGRIQRQLRWCAAADRY